MSYKNKLSLPCLAGHTNDIMATSDLPTSPPGMMLIRAGCALAYQATQPLALLLLVKPHVAPSQILVRDMLETSSSQALEEFTDAHGNTLVRTTLLPGTTRFRHDALILVPESPHELPAGVERVPIARLPPDALRYTFASRYCESDKLAQFANQHFGHIDDAAEQVRAVCDWTHTHIAYRYGSGTPFLSACDVIARGYGVCRDYAHVMIALCRALDIPARYVAGHMPYLGVSEADIGIDFHAYCEVFLGDRWHVFDPRHRRVHRGRVKIAHGMDAVDAAFGTMYGAAQLVDFQVWAYEITDPNEAIGGPVSIMRGADGSAVRTLAA
ncbi:transglutaminase-like domain-containing protein [Noviherbaspirillum saxi]|uniref:Transglutaminase family protein n=1 Tax=Noviherbaspirillum saxi TaxID=2320863 RepID=A0A3A3FNP0_9BURK|nr:transglutaminase family protein [Noviherbaspirillum saxi]RJF95289.1 transglutaminase family protein [Noviherbaspirillum saxi]